MSCMADAVGGAVGLSGSLYSLYAVFKDILWDVTDRYAFICATAVIVTSIKWCIMFYFTFLFYLSLHP